MQSNTQNICIQNSETSTDIAKTLTVFTACIESRTTAKIPKCTENAVNICKNMLRFQIKFEKRQKKQATI